MRIRIYSPYFPWPIHEGAHQVISNQVISLLQLNHEVELVIWKARADQVRPSAEEWIPNELRKGFQLTLLCDPLQLETNFERALRVLNGLWSSSAGAEEFYFSAQLDEHWRNLQGVADFALYHYSFSYNWLIRDTLKNLNQRENKIVLVQHNLEHELYSLRAERELNWVQRKIHRLNAKKMFEHELELEKLCDHLAFISPVDFAKRKQKLSPQTSAHLWVPGFDQAFLTKRNTQFAEHYLSNKQFIIGFIGGMNFDPNRDSVLWLLDKLCPVLEQNNFTGRLVIGGKSPTLEILEKAKKYSFVELIGFVGDLDSYWRSIHINLVPHLSGSGVRIKLLEGLASGCPSLTTAAGAERIHPDLLQHPLLKSSDQPEVWAQWILDSQQESKRAKLMSEILHPRLDGVKIYHEALNNV